MNKLTLAATAAILGAAGLLAAPAAANASLEPVYVLTPAKPARVLTPPARLPWDAAPLTTGPVTDPAPRAVPAAVNAHKGNPRSASTTKATLTGTDTFLYSMGTQAAATTGVYANSIIGAPTLATADYHTLGEISFERTVGTSHNVVEIGWNVDRVLYGNTLPHLFGFWWKNGAPMGYNASPGWVDNPSASGGTINLGDTLTAGSTAKKFGIEFSDGALWLAYDNVWIGYYPETNWTGTTLGGAAVTGGFHVSDYVQLFGEVAATSATPTTDMGTGVLASTSATAPISSRWSGTTYINGPTVDLWVRNRPLPDSPTKYNVAPYTTSLIKSFGFGGPGW
jgi:hypothetical protein